MSAFTKNLATRIADAITEGTHTIQEICKSLNIGRATYYRWLQDESLKVGDETFEAYIKKAKDRARTAQKDIAISSFMKCLQGHSYEEVTTEMVHDKTGEQEPRVTHTKIVKKFTQPNAAVVIFAMKNYFPEEFKDKIEVEGTPLTYKEAFAIKYGKKPTEVPISEN